MEESYQPSEIESKVRSFWKKNHTFRVSEDLSKEKFYCLAMFPYPSGRLHMGHVRNYALGDLIARYQRMLGRNVLQPIGFDAFGLPAENAALQHNIAPSTWTYENMQTMREQFASLGFAFDWSREIASCDPSYYRWEQWLFTQLMAKGLVYRKESVVNWDPVDQTVLANEQVIDGRGWRSGAVIERRSIPQWFLKITDYAESLLRDLDTLDGWPEQVKTMQRHWIGRSEGLEIEIQIEETLDAFNVFTTRPDTWFGVSFVALSPEHPLAQKIAEKFAQSNPAIAHFIEAFKRNKVSETVLATLEKEGVFSGLHCVLPGLSRKIPLWIANYVLMDYGSGAVIGVPAHDERDFEFAQKYHVPIYPVIAPADQLEHPPIPFYQPGVMIHSETFNGLDSEAAKKAIADHLVAKNTAEYKVFYRLRDWGISRQRYWGAPIPVIYCDACGPVAVPEDQLPVLLPTEVHLDAPGSPLKTMESFYKTSCPQCGKPATRKRIRLIPLLSLHGITRGTRV